jgi:hypothetical protein
VVIPIRKFRFIGFFCPLLGNSDIRTNADVRLPHAASHNVVLSGEAARKGSIAELFPNVTEAGLVAPHSQEQWSRTLEVARKSRVMWPRYSGGHVDLVTRLETSMSGIINVLPVLATGVRQSRTGTPHSGTHGTLRDAIEVWT